jgi:hypothetical protein
MLIRAGGEHRTKNEERREDREQSPRRLRPLAKRTENVERIKGRLGHTCGLAKPAGNGEISERGFRGAECLKRKK